MRKRSYLQWVLLLFLATLLILPSVEARADGPDSETPSSEEAPTSDESYIDWSQFSYEELLLIRDDLDAYIHEMERQYAIENGNRIITLNEEEVTLYNKKTFALQAEVKRVVEDAPEKTTFIWKSSDESVAKVSNTGIVTGMGYGDATITCTASDDEYIFAESVFHIVLPVSALTLDQANVTLLLSDQNPSSALASLSCAIQPENAHIKDVVWSSSDPNIVTVDEKGHLSAVSPGTAMITVRAADPESTARPMTSRVTVLQAVTKLSLSDSSLSININANAQLKVTAFPENASNKKVVWASSNTSVATVTNNGLVRAVAPGTARITCTADDGSGVSVACDVRCIQMITSVKFDTNQRTITVNKGKSSYLRAVILPNNASDKSLTWSSSNSKIVSVTSDGKVTGVSGGSATITCTAKDGSGKTASIEVYVPSIAVNKTEYRVTSKKGLDIEFHYYGRNSDFSYTITPQSLCNISKRQNGDTITLSIIPNKAGAVTVTLKDSSDRRSDTKITIIIDHSACYDTTSYPTGDYSSVLRSPSSYKGMNMSIYGRVLQIGTSWGSTYMRVATRGRYDNVFYVECPTSVASGIIEDDYITIYGTCTGSKTYTAVSGASITIPSIDAEKIVFGRN